MLCATPDPGVLWNRARVPGSDNRRLSLGRKSQRVRLPHSCSCAAEMLLEQQPGGASCIDPWDVSPKSGQTMGENPDTIEALRDTFLVARIAASR